MDLMGSSAAPAADRRAIVIGGSIAGLLAARVLADRYDEVVVLERDELPEHAVQRKGTPHAVHPHGLLARGLQVLEELFPGFTNALLARGAGIGDIGLDVAVEANGRRFIRTTIGSVAVAASRLLIEAELRQRVRGLPRVRIVAGASVLTPTHEAGRVTGVQLQRADDTTGKETWPATLVIDCSGRGSRSPAWLRDWGYEPPVEERVTIGLAYTSAYFSRDPLQETTAVIGSATPELPRPYILLAQEPDAEGRARWVAGVGGYAGDHVESTLEAMGRRAEEVGSREIAALAHRGEVLGPVMSYNFSYSQRRRYERMRKFPNGLLVMGDALASFNPIYGQGMSVAACEALALRDVLKQTPDPRATPFFAAAAKIIDVPWQIAVGGDLALPQIPGPRPFPTRLVNSYIGRVQKAAVDDPVLAAAFVKVIHLLAPPPTLMAPALIWRVLRHRRSAPSIGAPTPSAISA
jgi:2-polyprenyl-6-methoxyphenol hydroxylase-like FAD-dependent oxidoreductase